ncbi:MAG: STAS domain-containing protein [Acidobacteriota bacterium]
MQRNVTVFDDVTVIELTGKLVAGVGDELLAHSLGEAFEQGFRKIVLNLEGVSYIDSAGVGEIASSLQKTQALGARLATTKMGGRVQRVLQLSQVLPLLDVHESQQAAIDALQQPAEAADS